MKWMSGWPLFWLLTGAITILMSLGVASIDLYTPEGVSEMIQYSVRCAVPFIFLVTATSSLAQLTPNRFTRWLMRNRRYFGLSFAVAMGWQAAFIFRMSFFFTDHYYSEIYYLRDELEGSSGYIFLTAMTITSFMPVRRFFTSRQWTALHKAGVYFLWAYPFSVYWWNVYYYQTGALIDYIFYWFGFSAFALRIAAWGKKRIKKCGNRPYNLGFPSSIGLCFIGLGLFMSGFGSYWQPHASKILLSPSWSSQNELWLPYWPFEPFLPLLIMGIGVWIATMVQTSAMEKPDEQAHTA